MRITGILGILAATCMLGACIKGSNGGGGGITTPPPTPNTVAITVDGGPAAAPGQINVPYVTVKICAAGSTSQCASIDHVKVDTGSWGLRVAASVLAADKISLAATSHGSGQTDLECVHFAGGYTWGPVAPADVTLAGEVAKGLIVQVLDDTNAGPAPPAASPCGMNGGLSNDPVSLGANGILGVGVFAQDCGSGCVGAATPLPIYYGCTAAGVCVAENMPLAGQVANPVAQFATDNNGVIVSLPALINANGDSTVTGELIFGLSTQADNALPASLSVLGTDANGDFQATFNSAMLPSLIDSGTNFLAFDDATLPVCTDPNWVGYYCPSPAPAALTAANTGQGSNPGSNTVDFAIQDPSTAFQTGKAAYGELGGGKGSSNFTWGTPFFYGRKIYVGIESKAAGSFTGPFYAY